MLEEHRESDATQDIHCEYNIISLSLYISRSLTAGKTIHKEATYLC